MTAQRDVAIVRDKGLPERVKKFSFLLEVVQTWRLVFK